MYKTMSRVNIKQPKQKVKTVVKNVVKIIEKEPERVIIDNTELLSEIEFLKSQLETNNEILDENFKLSHQQEDRISELREKNKILSKKMIEKDKIEIDKKADEIEEIIEKSEQMLKKITKPKIIKPLVKPVIQPVRKIQPLVRKSVPTIIKKT